MALDTFDFSALWILGLNFGVFRMLLLFFWGMFLLEIFRLVLILSEYVALVEFSLRLSDELKLPLDSIWSSLEYILFFNLGLKSTMIFDGDTIVGPVVLNLELVKFLT